MFRSVFLTLLAFGCCGAAAAAPARAKQSSAPVSVLFIGNSYTYAYDLPAVVAAMGKAGKVKLNTQSYTAGATALIQFWEDAPHAKARELVKNGGFDYVVLQDQSVTPCTSPQWTKNFGGKWAQLAHKVGSKPVFFITWAHIAPNGKDFDAAMQDELTAVYRATAQANDALCAPVGEAWRQWYRKHPQEPLHADDGSHPNALGAYLSACVFYRVLSKKSAVGLPCRLRTGPRATLSVPAEKAKECQQIADAVVKAEKEAAKAAPAAAESPAPAL